MISQILIIRIAITTPSGGKMLGIKYEKACKMTSHVETEMSRY